MKDGTHYRTRAQNFLRENLLIARSDPGNDLDPSLVHRLEPLSLLLGILVWDGADGVAALALAVGGSPPSRAGADDDLVDQHLRKRTPVLRRQIAKSSRRRAQTVACPLSVASRAATCRVR